MPSSLPRLSPRDHLERVASSRLMLMHEIALGRHLNRVIAAVGQSAARHCQQNGEDGAATALGAASASIDRVLRPALRSTAREFGQRLFSTSKSSYGLEVKAFETLDAEIDAFIASHAADRVVQISDSLRALIREIIRRGVQEDLSSAEVAQQIVAATSGEMSIGRARRIALTETHTAANAGQLAAARQSPLQYVKRWLATEDRRTREAHAAANGQTVDLDEPFIVDGEELMVPGDPKGSPGNIINCFPAGTLVSGAAVAATRHWFEGDLVEITTARGYKLAGTRNHPVLTPEGWVALGALHKSSYVFSRGECRNEKRGRASNRLAAHQVKHAEPRIEQVFDALAVSRVTVREMRLAVNFHGDQPAEDVDIVRADGVLMLGRESHCFQHADELALALARLGKSDLLARCLADLLGHAGGGRSSGDVGCKGEPLSRPRIGLGHASEHGGAAASDLHALAQETCANAAARNSKSTSQGEFGHALTIEADKIVDINIRAHRGHVYNLETVHGLYEANGIVAHNCRCTVQYLPILASQQQIAEEEEREPITSNVLLDDPELWRAFFREMQRQAALPADVTLYATGPDCGIRTFAAEEDLQELIGEELMVPRTASLSPILVNAGAGLADTFPLYGKPVVVVITVPAGTPAKPGITMAQEILLQEGIRIVVTGVTEERWGDVQEDAGVPIDPAPARYRRRLGSRRGVTLVEAKVEMT